MPLGPWEMLGSGQPPGSAESEPRVSRHSQPPSESRAGGLPSSGRSRPPAMSIGHVHPSPARQRSLCHTQRVPLTPRNARFQDRPPPLPQPKSNVPDITWCWGQGFPGWRPTGEPRVPGTSACGFLVHTWRRKRSGGRDSAERNLRYSLQRELTGPQFWSVAGRNPQGPAPW